MAHKILLIDDEKTNLALVKFGLANFQYEVIESSDPRKALDWIRDDCPDLIVLDIMMPEMSGYEFMAELKHIEEASLLPVIMLTANENMQEIFQLEGVKGYFVKPVRIDLLVKKIEECLGKNPL